MLRLLPGASVALVLVAAACARAEAPTGGPRDLTPPWVVSVSPDTFSLLEPGDRVVRFEFSERISEEAFGGGTLEQAVQVSPRTGEVEVKHGRSSLEVRIEGGFLANRVYRITVLPVVKDMFQNPLRAPFELVVSTGPDFQPTVLGTLVTDWLTGAPIDRAVVEARSLGEVADTIPYLAASDTGGFAIFRYLPPGDYALRAFEDVDLDGVADYTEVQRDTVAGVQSSDTLLLSLELIRPDTTPAVLQSVTVLDSLDLRASFDDYLALDLDFALLRIALQEDSTGAQMEIAGPITDDQWAALQVDTTGAAPTDPSPDTLPPPPGHEHEVTRSFILRLISPLVPGREYTLRVEGAVNLTGVPGGGGEYTFAVPDTASGGGDIEHRTPGAIGPWPSVSAPEGAEDTGNPHREGVYSSCRVSDETTPIQVGSNPWVRCRSH